MFELGPGRGTLMHDLLKVWSKQKETFGSELFVYMIESSPFLRKLQLKTLCQKDDEPKILQSYTSKFSESIKVTWLEDLVQMPRMEAPQFFLANEFFDALPIHKFQVDLSHNL